MVIYLLKPSGLTAFQLYEPIATQESMEYNPWFPITLSDTGDYSSFSSSSSKESWREVKVHYDLQEREVGGIIQAGG